MDGEQPEVDEERTAPAGTDELARLVGHALVHMAARLVGDRGVVDKLAPRREVASAGARSARDMRPVHIEALILRLVGIAGSHVVPEVPFSKMSGGVARALQRLGKGMVVGLQTCDRVRDVDSRIARQELLFEGHFREMASGGGDAGACGMLTDHDAGARRRAERAGGVGMGQPHAPRSEAVEVRCLVVGAAKATQVAGTEVVGENQHDIGAVRSESRERREQQGGEEGEGVFHG